MEEWYRLFLLIALAVVALFWLISRKGSKAEGIEQERKRREGETRKSAGIERRSPKEERKSGKDSLDKVAKQRKESLDARWDAKIAEASTRSGGNKSRDAARSVQAEKSAKEKARKREETRSKAQTKAEAAREQSIWEQRELTELTIGKIAELKTQLEDGVDK